MAYLAFLLALVLGKLDAKTFLRVCNPLHRRRGNLEFTITRSASANCRDCSKPFEHSKSALFHVFRTNSRYSTFHFKKGQRVALAGPYNQKSVKLMRAKFLSSSVTKIAVCKFAI
jgi:hypothetical protein